MKPSLKRALLCSIVAGLMVMAYTPAQAHLQTRTDGNDTPGPLDIRQVSFRHQNGIVRVTVTTSDPWNAAMLGDEEDSADRFLSFQFDSKGNPNTHNGRYTDYLAVGDNFGGELKGKLYKFNSPPYPAKTISFVANIGAKRRGDRTLKLKIPMYLLHPRESYMGWSANSNYKDKSACTGNGCFDKAPNDFLYNHDV